LVIHKKLSLVTLSLCPRRITAGCVIVFEMFRRNGDGTFIVAVKIGGDSKKIMGLGAISFDKAFKVHSIPYFVLNAQTSSNLKLCMLQHFWVNNS
jgi:hypothetical protein